MSTAVQFIPEASETKITQFVRLDNDFQMTIGINTSGIITYHFYNVQGIQDDYTYRPADSLNEENLVQAQLAKDQGNEALTFTINMFYNNKDDSLQPYQRPQPWIYSSEVTEANYMSRVLPSSISHSFPVTIWDTLPNSEDPTTQTNNATVPSSITNRLYARLGSTARRREYLKQKLRTVAEDRRIPFILAGNYFGPISASSISIDETGSETKVVIQQKEFGRQNQMFSYRLEMLTRAIAYGVQDDGTEQDPIVSNFETEDNFNLLDGEIGLDSKEVFMNGQREFALFVAGIMSRPGWTFYRFGSVAASSPFAYTAPTSTQIVIGRNPTGQTGWPAVRDATFNLGTAVPDAVTNNWLEWLRS